MYRNLSRRLHTDNLRTQLVNMFVIFHFLAFSIALSNQTPLREVDRVHTKSNHGNGDSMETEKKFSRRGTLDCPFSHPSVRGLKHTGPVLRNLDHRKPPFLHSKRDLELKTKYVDHDGWILSYQTREPQIRVDATEGVSDLALSIAAETIRKMTQHMADDLFNECATKTSVGLFTEEESMVVYPEYADLAPPPGCGTSCEDECDTQCTFDGRTYSSLAGAGGERAVIVEDNVLCNDDDPYYNTDNVLVHEYAHSIKLYCLPEALQSKISKAYDHAKEQGIWSNEYAMATEEEYWAVGTETWFRSTNSTYATGGMNVCSGSLCTSTYAARLNLYEKDITLYGLLMKVYADNRPDIYVGMKPCTTLD